ncbi:MAG: hypothetical protein AAGD25_12630 [Cyanobacteria bacterium P01_F01_bin.150]
MKYSLSFIFICVVLISGCTTKLNENSVELLSPYLSALKDTHKNEVIDDFDTPEERRLFATRRTEERLKRLNTILNDKTSAGDEAIAYLLFLYTGEYSGSVLSCEAAQRGDRMIPIIRRYQRLIPKTGLEPYPDAMQGSGVLPSRVLRYIQSGETC